MSRTRHHGYKAKDRSGRNDHWCRNEPKAWRKAFKHRPRRAAVRRLATAAARHDDPGSLIWPLDKQPHIYYW